MTLCASEAIDLSIMFSFVSFSLDLNFCRWAFWALITTRVSNEWFVWLLLRSVTFLSIVTRMRNEMHSSKMIWNWFRRLSSLASSVHRTFFIFFFSAARLVLMINSLCPKSEKWIKYELIDSHVFNQRIIDEKCGFCQQKTQTNRFDHVTYLIEITTAYEYCILMWHSTASSLVKNVIINSFTFIIWINYQYNRIEMCRSELIFTSSFNFAPKKRKGKTKYMQKFIKQRRMRWEARENSSLLCIFSFDHLPQTYLRRKLSLFCKAIRKTCKISGNDDSCRHYSVSCKKTRSRNTQSQVDLAGAARAHDEQWR